MEELKNLPLDVTVTFLVAEDSEFLTGQVIEYALPEGAVNGYRMIASVVKNTVPAIGFKMHRVRDEEYKDVHHYFFTKDEEGPDFSVEGVGFEYKEVRELVEKVFALAKEQGLWNGKPEPTVRLWARIGMSLEVPKSTFDRLKEASTDRYGRFTDLILDWRLISEFVDHGFADGESYVPADEFEEGGAGLC